MVQRKSRTTTPITRRLGRTSHGNRATATAAKRQQIYNPSTGTYARGATASNAYGSQSAGQAYNPKTGAYGATEQGSNANGSWGSSTVSKNGNTAYSQHQTTSQGTTGSVTNLERWPGLWRVGQIQQRCGGSDRKRQQVCRLRTATTYKNTGSGGRSNTNGSWNNVQKPSQL